jgi:copper chaperone CopZ
MTVQTKLNVSGMSCDGCVRHVRKALEKLPGVETKNVAIGSAEVAYDPAKVKAEDIAEALRKAGYPATPA